MLLQKMQSGQLESTEAERLAMEAMNKKEQALKQATTMQANYEQQKAMSDKLQTNVTKLKQSIGQYENELTTLRARAKTASSMRKIDQQMSKVDSSSTISMLEKMKTKVNEEESLAEAYADVAELGTGSVDSEIDKALASGTSPAAADSLAALKAKMGITE